MIILKCNERLKYYLRCKKERPEEIYKRVMGLLDNVSVRVNGLNNTADHLASRQLEHEKTHQKYKEETQEKMNDMNCKILEIRQLCGFSKTRDAVLRGPPDGEESSLSEEFAKSAGKKWIQLAKSNQDSEEKTAERRKSNR